MTWEAVFPRGADCDNVEFLIKSHPLDAPSNYKLSDLTLKGKRTAVLAVPPGEDFIFQVRIYIVFVTFFLLYFPGDSAREQGPGDRDRVCLLQSSD